MNLTLNQQFLNKLIIVLVAGMIITGVLVGLKVAGVFGSESKNALSSTANNVTGNIGNGSDERSSVNTRGINSSASPSGESDEKKVVTVTWVFKNETFIYSRTVSNSTYSVFKQKAAIRNGSATSGTVPDERLQRYIVTTGDDGLTQSLATYFLNESQSRGWGDYDTIANLVTFMQHYNSAGTFQNLPGSSSYKYPYMTFYDESGSRDDVTVFAGSVLEAMGYPVGLLVYPQQYDRGYFIYPYEGIAIRSNESVPGTKYYSEKATYIGTVSCEPVPGQYSVKNMTAFRPADGIFRGNTTIYYLDNRTVPAGIAEYDIRTGTMGYAKDFAPPTDAVPDHFVLENVSYIGYEYFSYIDTADPKNLPGTIPGALAKATPSLVTTLIDDKNQIRIYRDDRMTGDLQPSLRSPAPLASGNSTKDRVNFTGDQSITDALRIPVASGDIDDVAPQNEQAKDEYWHDVWYDRSNWYYNQKWYLDVLNYNVIENQYLYTRQGEIFVAPATAWRIRYRAIPTNPPDQDVPGLSTFSDMRFAVYKVDPTTNTATLFDTFSYGYETGQNTIKYRNYYQAGSFYIAVFVRNCKADVSIQMNGKNPNTS
ncbi:MAG: hypothetical protein WC367_01090 [Methanoregula sp.]|jgi:hypothetical protein